MEMKLPILGENIVQGDVVKILVAPGDKISKGQSIIELETDKAVIEIPASEEGVVASILAHENEVIRVGDTILILGESGIDHKPELPPQKKSSAVVPREVSRMGPQGRRLEQLKKVPRLSVRDFEKYGPIEKQKFSKLRRVISERTSLSWKIIPHVTQCEDASLSELMKLKKKLRITLTPLIIKLLVKALQEEPRFNSSLIEEEQTLVLKKFFHIGVAMDTPEGLIAPVIRDGDKKTVKQINAELIDLANRARKRTLELSELEGSSFSLSNLGPIGGTYFTPLVRYPEVAVLGLGRSVERLIKQRGKITTELVLPLSLSYDHRVIDGADAARFLIKIKNFIERPNGDYKK